MTDPGERELPEGLDADEAADAAGSAVAPLATLMRLLASSSDPSDGRFLRPLLLASMDAVGEEAPDADGVGAEVNPLIDDAAALSDAKRPPDTDTVDELADEAEAVAAAGGAVV